MVHTDVDNWKPKTRREFLAQAIAQTFQEEEHVKRYLDCCKKYGLNIVYRAFAEAKSIPEARIKKSRAAVFFYLIKKYSHERR